jgi:Sodium/calcium exchanger protein
MWSVLLILAGLAGLLVGAELLVRGSTALASRLGIRPMVIGLTVVSLGTSLPELAIGIDAARQGSPGLAVGNIVGTNLVNILFILGLSALIRPISFERPTLRFDLPAMTAASLALWLLALDGDEAAAELAGTLSRMVRRSARSYGGKPVKWLGDGVMFFFPDPGPGVLAAIDMVEGAANAGLPPAPSGSTRDRSCSRRATTSGAP